MVHWHVAEDVLSHWDTIKDQSPAEDMDMEHFRTVMKRSGSEPILKLVQMLLEDSNKMLNSQPRSMFLTSSSTFNRQKPLNRTLFLSGTHLPSLVITFKSTQGLLVCKVQEKRAITELYCRYMRPADGW